MTTKQIKTSQRAAETARKGKHDRNQNHDRNAENL